MLTPTEVHNFDGSNFLPEQFEKQQFQEADTIIDALESKEVQARLEQITAELNAFAQANGFRSLEDRTRRGLYTIGMLALPEVRVLTEELATKMGANIRREDLDAPAGFEDIITNIQRRGPWEYTQEMTSENPSEELKVWMMMNAAISIDMPREKDLNQKEFLKHVEHIKILLQQAIDDSENFWERTKKEIFEKSVVRMRYEDGVPISEMGQGFIPAALQGYEAGVIQDADGTPLIGAKNAIDPKIFERWGLTMREEDDGRGRVVPTYYSSEGQKLFRQLFPGFLVIDAKTFPLAAAIVRAVEMLADGVAIEDLEIPSQDVLGVTMYVPTSSEGKEDSQQWVNMDYLRSHLEETIPGEEITPSTSTEILSLREEFYRGMHWIKSHVIALDVLDDANAKKEKKGKGALTEEEKMALYRKVETKMGQKMDELRFLMDIIGNEIEKLPEGEKFTIEDMAGGAGDLGLAVATYMIAKGKNLDKTKIIDPFSKYARLDTFTDFILDHIPFQKELRGNVFHTNESIQQAKIDDNAIVVAKHPCGDLADLIIEKWVASESPMLVIMTCCQDKACGCPARYDIAQSDWNNWCRDSSRTNVELPDPSEKGYAKMKAKLESGKESMTKLDTARVEYLRRHGFDAQLLNTDKFPKGDVIIARRKK